MENKAPHPGLLRALGPFTATAIVAGTVIGSGVFKKPALVAANVPGFNLTALVWILVGLLALLGALTLAEVTVLFPRAGGNYVFLREGYGRLAGFLWGWVEFWIIRSASIAALAAVFIESLHDILKQVHSAYPGEEVLSFWQLQLLTVGVLFVLAAVNIRGVRWGGGLQLGITIVKVASLLTILLLPFLLWSRIDHSRGLPAVGVGMVGLMASPLGQGPLLVAAALPKYPTFSLGDLGTAFLGVLWAYHGWMNVAPVAGEVKNPQRNIPLAFLAGVGIVIFLYLGANLAYWLVIPQPEMALLSNTTVVAEFAGRLLGPIGTALASGAVMCSVFGALNGNILVGPRVLFAMGEDGLAPKAVAAIQPRFHTPAIAIAVLTGWSIIQILIVAAFTRDKSMFDTLTDFAMFGAVIFETMAVSTIFVFRRRLPDVPRPYRCWGYPVVPLLYLVLPAFILTTMLREQTVEAAAGLGFIAVGAAVYFGFGLQHKRMKAEG